VTASQLHEAYTAERSTRHVECLYTSSGIPPLQCRPCPAWVPANPGAQKRCLKILFFFSAKQWPVLYFFLYLRAVA